MIRETGSGSSIPQIERAPSSANIELFHPHIDTRLCEGRTEGRDRGQEHMGCVMCCLCEADVIQSCGKLVAFWVLLGGVKI